MKEIKLKAYPELFEKVLSGEKNFDIRLGDKDIEKEDIIILVEIDKNRNLTGREIRKKVKFVLRTKEMNYWNSEEIEKEGFVVAGF